MEKCRCCWPPSWCDIFIDPEHTLIRVEFLICWGAKQPVLEGEWIKLYTVVVLHCSGSGPCFPHFFWASATATRPKPDHAKTSPWRQVHPASVHGFPVFSSHGFGYQKCPEFPWAVSFETDRPRNGTSPSLYKVMPWGHRIALWMEPTNMGIE